MRRRKSLFHKWCWGVLSTNGFEKGKESRLSITDDRPQVAVAAELLILIPRLIIAYADPHRFFREIAPQTTPDHFDPKRLSEPLSLGHTIWRWGFGVFLNDDVRRAFDSATSDQLIEIIGHGTGKGKAKKKRVDFVRVAFATPLPAFRVIGTKKRVYDRTTAIEKKEILERSVTKGAIDEIAQAGLRAQLSGEHKPNEITRVIADWPFEGYITSNFDGLIESALHDMDRGAAWVSVGNTEPEIRKVSRQPGKVVWHVHGYLGHDQAKSDLILTNNDYARLYGEGSLLTRQLAGLLAQKQLIFVGFGFNDRELRRTLELVGHLTPITKPVLALLPRSLGDERCNELAK